ncbi:uncharacterized protein LOC126846154 [Adelges cooleyi]|uniref:uncharacterized protein LOC126846154 n=1 Tax=Adelges cooleyi TaxID=133065 RepID=UPI0021801357|nr:uncharacterized protein LOC126846154 [Adelges cooleyi]
MFNKVVSSCLLVAVPVLCAVGYCIYFDHTRRNHPDFKKNLREKRQKAKNQSIRTSFLAEQRQLLDTAKLLAQQLHKKDMAVNIKFADALSTIFAYPSNEIQDEAIQIFGPILEKHADAMEVLEGIVNNKRIKLMKDHKDLYALLEAQVVTN